MATPKKAKPIEEGAVDNPRKGKAYLGNNEHLSQNDEGFSGHPHLSDGSPRYDSQTSSPRGEAPSTVTKGPVNPKK